MQTMSRSRTSGRPFVIALPCARIFRRSHRSGSSAPIPAKHSATGNPSVIGSSTSQGTDSATGSTGSTAGTGSTGGTSGGPMLVPWPGGWAVIGVIGGYHTGGNTPQVSYSAYYTGRMPEVFDDLAETHRVAGASDHTDEPEALAPAAPT